jgi:hypothetical protein
LQLNRSNVAAPIIKHCDGDYQYEKYKNYLVWKSTSIDQSNSTGSLEFSVAGHANDFFPIHVSFVSQKSYCDIQVIFLVKFVLIYLIIQLYLTIFRHLV